MGTVFLPIMCRHPVPRSRGPFSRFTVLMDPSLSRTGVSDLHLVPFFTRFLSSQVFENICRFRRLFFFFLYTRIIYCVFRPTECTRPSANDFCPHRCARSIFLIIRLTICTTHMYVRIQTQCVIHAYADMHVLSISGRISMIFQCTVCRPMLLWMKFYICFRRFVRLVTRTRVNRFGRFLLFYFKICYFNCKPELNNNLILFIFNFRPVTLY